jgi:hypothetical protein
VVQYKTISPNVKRGTPKNKKARSLPAFFDKKRERIAPWSNFTNSFEIRNREAITPDLGGLPDMINVPGFKNCSIEIDLTRSDFFCALLMRSWGGGRQLVEKTREPRFLVCRFVAMNDAAIDQFVEKRNRRVQILLNGLPIGGGYDFF